MEKVNSAGANTEMLAKHAYLMRSKEKASSCDPIFPYDTLLGNAQNFTFLTPTSVRKVQVLGAGGMRVHHAAPAKQTDGTGNPRPFSLHEQIRPPI